MARTSLPTFFEIPIGLTLLAGGAPAGAALAVLFAGPIINLPSLLTIARSAGWKVAGAVFFMSGRLHYTLRIEGMMRPPRRAVSRECAPS